MTAGAIMPTYNRLPVAFERGEGPWLFDVAGRRYLDALSGIAVCVLGHAHPAVAKALAEQATTLIHTSNLYGVPKQQALAERLTALAGMDNVFFCNSGTEANEAAIKIARRHAVARGIGNPVIVCCDGAFHGRTMGALSATGSPRAHAGFDPLLPGFVHVPYGDAAAVRAKVESDPNVVAVLVEPIQGEGGIVVPPDGYLAELRALADANDLLLMCDEVQTGVGRTGHWFAHQAEGIVPDVMTLAKALANGVPIGACLAHGKAAGLLSAGMHGSTFGGNPLASAAALAVLDTIDREGIVERAARMGERLRLGLAERLAPCRFVKEVRGRGMMVGVVLTAACPEIVTLALTHGLLVNVTAGNVIRLLPPLILDEAEVDSIVDGVCRCIGEWAKGQVVAPAPDAVAVARAQS